GGLVEGGAEAVSVVSAEDEEAPGPQPLVVGDRGHGADDLKQIGVTGRLGIDLGDRPASGHGVEDGIGDEVDRRRHGVVRPAARRCPALLGRGCLRTGLPRVGRARVGSLRIGRARVGSLPRILGRQGLRPGAGAALEEMGPCSLPRELVLLLPCQFGTLLRAMSALLLLVPVLLVFAHQLTHSAKASRARLSFGSMMSRQYPLSRFAVQKSWWTASAG